MAAPKGLQIVFTPEGLLITWPGYVAPGAAIASQAQGGSVALQSIPALPALASEPAHEPHTVAPLVQESEAAPANEPPSVAPPPREPVLANVSAATAPSASNLVPTDDYGLPFYPWTPLPLGIYEEEVCIQQQQARRAYKRLAQRDPILARFLALRRYRKDVAPVESLCQH